MYVQLILVVQMLFVFLNNKDQSVHAHLTHNLTQHLRWDVLCLTIVLLTLVTGLQDVHQHQQDTLVPVQANKLEILTRLDVCLKVAAPMETEIAQRTVFVKIELARIYVLELVDQILNVQLSTEILSANA
jgi:hypothetical protein